MAGETQAKKLRLVVLVSGSGTNLQAMIDRIADGRLHAEIAAVISDNPDAFGLERAKKHGIPAVVIDYSKYSKKHLENIPWEKLPEHFNQIVQSQRLFPHLHGSKLRERLARMVLAEQELVTIIDSYKVVRIPIDNGISQFLITRVYSQDSYAQCTPSSHRF